MNANITVAENFISREAVVEIFLELFRRVFETFKPMIRDFAF
ncbi:MAG: hypothetical protein ACYDEZ_09005 [Methanoregula sp.]